MFTCSPEGFYYISQGYFDKEDNLSRLLRLQTYHLVRSSGATLQGGGDIGITDLWKLESDKEESGTDNQLPSWAETPVELRDRLIAEFNKQK